MTSLAGYKVAFRADASLLMGTGHVMRCLTLADELKARGATCHFIGRDHPGHLLDFIRHRGFSASLLSTGVPAEQPANDCAEPTLAHAGWLGCSWQIDAEQTAVILRDLNPDWLVVDHYALDERWETVLQEHYRRLLVFDDLADRTHRCDILLDQNLGRQASDYAGLVPKRCRVLAGPRYALLRPEFAALRDYSLQRRRQPALGHLLVAMGGVDQPNATGQVLSGLRACRLPADCRISVVMGQQAPWLQEIREQAARMPWPTEVLVNIQDMARRMADSDLAIGAAGGTSWERCCMGLPTLMMVLADNQWPGARALQAAHAARLLGDLDTTARLLPPAVDDLMASGELERMSAAASVVTDGLGGTRVIQEMESNNG